MAWIIVGAALALQIAALTCIWRAVTTARTPQSSVGWSIFLIAAPLLAVPAYLFFGHHRYRGYAIARKTSEHVIRGIERQREDHPPLTVPVLNPAPFEALAEFHAVGGNAVDILIDGEATFDAIFAAIGEAQNYILVQFFIVHDDDAGRALRDRLVAAAGRGVSVRFMVDAVGSHHLPAAYLDALRAAGVQVADPKAGRRPRHRFQINFRNHRKTVIVDGRVGFTGGHNVGDEYLGRSETFGPWRDTHVRLQGPVVAQLQLVFAEDWHWATAEVLDNELFWRPDTQAADRTALTVPSGPGDELDTGTLFFCAAISSARERVWIASPYLVPDQEVLAALKIAALAGKDVRLIVPDAVDHWLPWLSSFAYYDELRQAGVRIFRYTAGFMHQKVVLVDASFAAIGTTNLDNRSFRLNFELMIAVFGGDFASEVAAFLEADLERTVEATTPLKDMPGRIRVGAPLARLFAPLL